MTPEMQVQVLCWFAFFGLAIACLGWENHTLANKKEVTPATTRARVRTPEEEMRLQTSEAARLISRAALQAHLEQAQEQQVNAPKSSK